MKTKTPTPLTPIELARSQIFAKLARLGIASVEITYDGSSDSGCVQSIEARGPDKMKVVLPTTPAIITIIESKWDSKTATFKRQSVRRTVPIEEAIESWCYDLLERHFSGWEIDDGSSGTIRLDVVKRTANWVHEQNVMETITHRREV